MQAGKPPTKTVVLLGSDECDESLEGALLRKAGLRGPVRDIPPDVFEDPLKAGEEVYPPVPAAVPGDSGPEGMKGEACAELKNSG